MIHIESCIMHKAVLTEVYLVLLVAPECTIVRAGDAEHALLYVQRCTTSYVRLPADYPKLLSSHRPQDLHIPWNDTWVSVTSGSEDYSFKVLHSSLNCSHQAVQRRLMCARFTGADCCLTAQTDSWQNIHSASRVQQRCSVLPPVEVATFRLADAFLVCAASSMVYACSVCMQDCLTMRCLPGQ